jgi:hypothetical protein
MKQRPVVLQSNSTQRVPVLCSYQTIEIDDHRNRENLGKTWDMSDFLSTQQTWCEGVSHNERHHDAHPYMSSCSHNMQQDPSPMSGDDHIHLSSMSDDSLALGDIEQGTHGEIKGVNSDIDLSVEATQASFKFGFSDFRMNDKSTRIFLPEGRYTYDDVYDIVSQVWDISLQSLPFRFNGVGYLDDSLIDLGVSNTIDVSLPICGGLKIQDITNQVVNKRKKRGKRSTTTVTTLRVIPKKSNAPKRPKPQNRPIVNVPLSQFTAALRNPFAPTSFGCKVPDTFSLPTITAHVRYEVQLGTIAAQSYFGATFFPNPMVSYVLNAGSATSGLSAFGSLANLFYFVPRSSMDNTFDEYRVVAYGIKVSNLMAPLSATGRFIFTPLVLGGSFAGFDLVNGSSVGTTANWYLTATTGVSSAQSVSSSMLQKPSSIEVSAQDLLNNSFGFTMIPTSPIFYKFKNVGAQVFNTGYNLSQNGESVINSSTGTITGSYGEFTDNMDMTGGIALNILGEGLPAATTCLQVEVVVHIEGTPSINSAVNSLTLSGAQPLIGSTAAVEQSLGEASRNGFFKALRSGLEAAQTVMANPYAQQIARRVLSHYGGNNFPRLGY